MVCKGVHNGHLVCLKESQNEPMRLIKSGKKTIVIVVNVVAVWISVCGLCNVFFFFLSGLEGA